MTPAAFEALLRIARPPLKLALRERYLVVRRQDPAAAGRWSGWPVFVKPAVPRAGVELS